MNRFARSTFGRSAALTLLLVPIASVLPAIYARSDVEVVPLERLLSNAEARVADAPDDTDALHTLARLHAMAYAWELGEGDTVEASTRGDGTLIPSFGYEPPWVPWTRSRRQDSIRSENGVPTTGTAEQAKEHLETSIALYRRGLESDGQDTTIRLALAWTLRESGETDEARELLREVVAVAAHREIERGGHLGPLLAVEAIDYLLPLLDGPNDRAEIGELLELRGRLEALPRAITPIAVALRQGTVPGDLYDASPPVLFDLDGSGRKLPWPWLTADAAWLVWDPHGDGHIRSALQLFGSRSFGLFFDDGFQALDLLDDDRDGILRGRELDGLALWRDADRDGVSAPGEVVPVKSMGVVAIGCRATSRHGGFVGAPGSVRLRSGETLDSWDLVFEATPTTTPTGWQAGPTLDRPTDSSD